MINQLLHRQPVAVDLAVHRHHKLQVPVTEWSMTSRMNSSFCAVAEFGDACRDYPLVFVNTGNDANGKPQVAPIAVLGLAVEENLFLEGKSWRGRYMPAILRAYPFCTAKVNDERFAVCIDSTWPGVSTTEGTPLFTPEGLPSDMLKAAQDQLQVFEGEVQRTRLACQRLVELDVLRDMRFDATFASGRTHSVDGFLTVDQERMNAQSDATLLELHKQGMMGVIHAHWISLGNMRTLLDWHVQRHPEANAPAVSTGAANGTSAT